MSLSRMKLVVAAALVTAIVLIAALVLWSRQPYSPTSTYSVLIDHPTNGETTLAVTMDNCGGLYTSWLIYLPDRIEISIVETGTNRGDEFWKRVRGKAEPTCADIVELPLPGPIGDRVVFNRVTGRAIPPG